MNGIAEKRTFVAVEHGVRFQLRMTEYAQDCLLMWIMNTSPCIVALDLQWMVTRPKSVHDGKRNSAMLERKDITRHSWF
jgi:hypothetical protein